MFSSHPGCCGPRRNKDGEVHAKRRELADKLEATRAEEMLVWGTDGTVKERRREGIVRQLLCMSDWLLDERAWASRAIR
jgi:hypothetical protein